MGVSRIVFLGLGPDPLFLLLGAKVELVQASRVGVAQGDWALLSIIFTPEKFSTVHLRKEVLFGLE